MYLNLLHLYYFHQVAQKGSVTAASLALKIQQPALSIMLKKFEASIGFPVFEKRGRNLYLTEKGRELYTYSQEVFSKVQKLEEFIGQKTDEVSGNLKIATNDLVAHYFLAPIITRWFKEWPKVEFSILHISAQEACEKMLKDEIDFGLFFHGPEEMSGIEFEKIKKIPFVCVSAEKNVDLFIGSREVEYTLTKKFPTYEKLKKYHPQIKIHFNSNGLLLHKELALRGGGAAVLPLISVKDELKKKQLHNLLPKENLEFSLKLYQRKNKLLGRTQELFLEEVIERLN